MLTNAEYNKLWQVFEEIRKNELARNAKKLQPKEWEQADNISGSMMERVYRQLSLKIAVLTRDRKSHMHTAVLKRIFDL